MSIWKKLGGCLVSIPLIMALIITIANVGRDSSGFWILAVILLVVLALILSIPAGLLVWIGHRKDKKKKNNDGDKDEYEFQSFVN